MRAIKSFIVVGLTALLVLGAVAAPAHAAPVIVTTTADGITYTADSTNVAAGATVTAYNRDAGPVVEIPPAVTIGGTLYPVTTIGETAFFGRGLASVSLPDTLTTIGYAAFFGNALTSLTLPDTLTTIGESAFAANFLSAVSLPDTLTTIGEYTFSTNFLTSVTLPETLTTIGDGAFSRNALTSLTLPASVTTIGDGAFFDNALTSVRFLGPAPTFFGTEVFSSNPLVSYFWSFGTPQTAGGFTSPAWNGYTTQAIAIIRYDTDGGPAIAPAEAIVGTIATAQADPTKDGYSFAGWYTAKTGGTAWNFTTDKVAGDMTLFARYAAVPVTPAPVTPSPVDPAGPTVPATSAPTGTAALTLPVTGGTNPAVPAGVGALVLLAGIALLLTRRRRHTA